MRTLLTLATTLALGLMAASAPAQQAEPLLGRWKTLDDQTGRAMTVVEIYRAQNNTLAARIVENIAAPATCERCDGERRGKSIIGMPVLWNLKPLGSHWGDGNGFKPSSGDSFRARSVELVEGGRRLRVTGCKGPFCRSATWERE